MLSPHSHHSCFTHEVQKSLSPLHSAIKRQCRIQTLSYTSHTSLLVLYVHDKGCCWTFTKHSYYISRGSFVKFWLSNQGKRANWFILQHLRLYFLPILCYKTSSLQLRVLQNFLRSFTYGQCMNLIYQNFYSLMLVEF